MDININISKTHVFAETFRKKRAAMRASYGTTIFHFTSSGMLVTFVEGTEEQPRIKSILRLETDTLQKDPERTKALHDYLSSLGIRPTTRVLAVSSEGVTLRQLMMPLMPDTDLKQAVAWELKKKFFINPEEQLIGILGIQDVDGEEGPERLVNAFHVEKKATLARLSILTSLGLSIEAFWPGPAALSRLVGAQSEKESGDEIVVDIAASQIRITAVQHGLTMMARNVQAAGHGEAQFEKIAEEIQKTIDFYESQKYARPASHIFLTGGSADLEALCLFLTGKFSMKVSGVDGGRYAADGLAEEQRALLTGQPGLFAEALGALLVHEESLNFLPDEVRKLNRRRLIDRSMQKLFWVAAAVMAFWVGWVGVQSQMLSLQLGYLDREWKEIQSGKSAFTAIMAQEKNRRAMVKGAVDVPALLKELSRLTPSPIVLESLKLSRDEGTFKLTGIAQDAGNENVKLVTQYVANLSRSPFFQNVTLGQTMEESGAGRVRFQVEATFKSLV